MATDKWLEIITIRLSNPGNHQAVLDIFGQIQTGASKGPCNPRSVELYTQKNNQTDWSIFLCWQQQNSAPSKTRVGLTIAEEFRRLGFVNHGVWMKVEPEEKDQ